MPASSCTSRHAAQALMRILAIGESATSTTSAPASRRVAAAAIKVATLVDLGGSISTATTNRPAASERWRTVVATAGSEGTSGAGARRLDVGARPTFAHRLGDRGGMRRPRAATSSDDRGALVDRGERQLGHVPGSPDEPTAEPRGAAGVGSRRDRHRAGDRTDRSNEPERLRRALAAVHADHVGFPGRPGGPRPAPASSRARIVPGERRAREDHEAGRSLARGGERLLHLPQVRLGLDHQEVDAALGERLGLLPVGLERLLRLDASVRRQPHAERAHRAAHQLGPDRLASRTPAAFNAATRPPRPCSPRRKRFPPNVFETTSRAPASTNARCRDSTRPGSSVFHPSTLPAGGEPVASNDVPVPPSASNGPSSSRDRSASSRMSRSSQMDRAAAAGVPRRCDTRVGTIRERCLRSAPRPSLPRWNTAPPTRHRDRCGRRGRRGRRPVPRRGDPVTRPPSAPGPVVARASTCGEPCATLAPSVTLEWPTPITGADPIGYLVLRDGSQIGEVGPSARTFTDLGVTMGSTHAYQVVAMSGDGNSVPTVSVDATVPLPPPEPPTSTGSTG